MKNLTVKFDINSIDDLAKTLINSVDSKTILFYGDMGVGKTTLISALVKALGGTTEATSPSFSIVNEYKVTNDLVYHFDFYRIKDEFEALDIGIEDYFYSKKWVFIEWPEKIDVLLPPEASKVELKLAKNGFRTLKLSAK